MFAVPFPAEYVIPARVTTAIAGFDVVHCAYGVTTCVVESLNVTVAVKDCARPRMTAPSAGVTVINWGVAAVTITEATPLTPPAVAVMFTVPAASPVTTPCHVTPVTYPGIPGSLLTVATAGLPEDHWTELVRSCRLPCRDRSLLHFASPVGMQAQT